MINLENTYVLVRTPEENEKLLKEAEKQGFKWHSKNNCEPSPRQHFPDILRFYEDKNVIYKASVNSNCAFYEASELLGAKEMTAREFIERVTDIATPSKCYKRECSECVFSEKNTKCKRSLCNIDNWKGNADELLEIAKSGKSTICTPEEKAINNIEKFIENPDRTALNDEFVESLKLAVEKLKEVKKYKDLEERDLLVRLPCKEAYSRSGDFVYLIYDYEIIECVHCGLGIDPLSGKAYITLATDEKLFPYRSPDPEQDLDPTDWCTNATDVEVSELGKTVFLTREEAEKKLEEMKNEI